MPFQVSPDAPAIGPDSLVGHRPRRRRWASAQRKICLCVKRGRRFRCRLPRCFFSSRARDKPRGSPRPPFTSAVLIPRQVSPGVPFTGPELWSGHFPVSWRCASAHPRICASVRRGKRFSLRTPRRSASNWASDEPPGRPLHHARPSPPLSTCRQAHRRCARSSSWAISPIACGRHLPRPESGGWKAPDAGAGRR